ncbi:MAG: chemotaxis-specific protein-glutamate methyltransferase CheB [Candidatus Aureabacteria bacterium]|nr:chemotaxis-specific protein-glutamate methyltransferase CheB [Candidatus Auribacterota bacterium]
MFSKSSDSHKPDKKIRVLIVEDSPLICKILTKIFNTDEEIEVAGIANDGKKAVEYAMSLKPDIITMDINLPIMNGFEATKKIMAYAPTPILIVSSSLYTVEMNLAFKAISFGALDVVEKGPMETQDNIDKFGKTIVEKIKLLSKVKVITHPEAKIADIGLRTTKTFKEELAGNKIVGIVSSTGGPKALLDVITGLPDDFKFPVVIVQHIVPGFTSGLIDWLQSESGKKISLASGGSVVQPGQIYIAPENYHTQILHDGRIHLLATPPYQGHKPSGNILLRSLADSYGPNSIGVILTGMGSDGCEGLMEIRRKGGRTLAQDEVTSIVYGMPKVAFETGAAEKIFPIEKIGQEIIKLI